MRHYKVNTLGGTTAVINHHSVGYDVRWETDRCVRYAVQSEVKTRMFRLSFSHAGDLRVLGYATRE